MGVIQRKRINNDIYTRLTVLDNSGSPIDIEGALSYNVVARPHSSNGEYPVLTTANGNLIDVYFLASKQKEIGTYDFKLTFTKNDPSVLGEIATFTIDFCDAFELLPKTCHDSELQLGSDNIQGIISSINYSMMSPTERDDLAQRIATKNGTDQLSELLDVDLDNLSISDTIVFNGTHWVNTPFVGSGGSNNATWGNEVNNTISVTINGVQKVLSLSSHSHSWSSITNKPLTDNQFTSLLSLASQWEVDGNGDLFTNKNVTVNGTITATTFAGISQGGVGALNLSELLDVELTSPEENDVLVFEDSQWINKPIPEVVSDITWDGTDGDIGIIDISGTKYRFALEGHTHFINEIDAYHEGTLDSYNITDAYTKDQIDSLLGIGGSGNVHSIGILVPEGFTISNSVIVNRGVFNIGFEDGYELSTKLWHTRWKKAYNDSHIHGNMDVLNDLTPSLVAKWNLLATHLDDYDNPHKTRFVDLLEKPNSLSGYGITNAYTKREIDRMFNTSGGGGTGTISSIGLQVPQGLRVLNSPLTSNGDLIIGLEPGYEIPLANNVGGHTHGNLPVLEQLTQANIDVLSLLSIDAGNLRISTNAYSTGGLSAYGMGSGSGSGSGGNIDIEDNLVSTRADAALSANMGRELKDLIDGLDLGGGGVGSVTSVALTAPIGFSVLGSPITSTGTLDLSFATGYSLPTIAKQNEWDSKADGNHNHSGDYEPIIALGSSTQYWRGDKTWQTLDKAVVGLGNVTNESKETMFTNAALTGNPTAPTQALGNNSTRIASTAFVQNSLLNNDLFEKVLIDGVYYIKAKYGLFSVGGLSAYGNGTGGGGGGSNVSMILTDANSVALTVEGVTANLSRTSHSHNLTSLLDVNVSGATNGQVLQWNTSTNKWIAATVSSGSSSVAWGDITGKPSTFTPSAHNHDASDINAGTLNIGRIPTGTTSSTVALGNHTHSNYALSSHAHSGSDITSGTVPIARLPMGTTGTTVAYGNHTHTGVYEPAFVSGTTSQYRRGDKTWQTLNKAAVGLGNVDNTADVNKSVSSAATLTTARNINGTSFNGSSAITTANWGTARNLQVSLSKSTATSVNGSANVTDIGVSGTLPIANGGTGNTSGLAASATILATSRTIWGQSFNGSANVTGAMTGVTSISMSAAITGATNITGSGTLKGNKLDATLDVKAPKYDFGNNWTLEADGSDIVLKQSGTVRGRWTSQGFASTGGLTAYSSGSGTGGTTDFILRVSGTTQTVTSPLSFTGSVGFTQTLNTATISASNNITSTGLITGANVRANTEVRIGPNWTVSEVSGNLVFKKNGVVKNTITG